MQPPPSSPLVDPLLSPNVQLQQRWWRGRELTAVFINSSTSRRSTPMGQVRTGPIGNGAPILPSALLRRQHRYLAMVGREGISQSIHDEVKAIAKLRFDYRDKMVSADLSRPLPSRQPARKELQGGGGSPLDWWHRGWLEHAEQEGRGRTSPSFHCSTPGCLLLPTPNQGLHGGSGPPLPRPSACSCP